MALDERQRPTVVRLCAPRGDGARSASGSSRGGRQAPELLSLLACEVHRIAQREHVEARVAERISRGIAEFLRRGWGGLSVYVPRDCHSVRVERDREIWMRFQKGETYSRLASRFALSERQVRRVVKRHRRQSARGVDAAPLTSVSVE